MPIGNMYRSHVLSSFSLLGLATFLITPAYASLASASPTTCQTEELVVRGVKIKDVQEQGSGADVQEGPSGFYGSGYIVGRPAKASSRGMIFNTWELNINMGAFEEESTFPGTIIHCSTDVKSVFNSFNGLDEKKLYVFEYKYVNAFNPEIEDSHLQITAVYTPDEFLTKKGVTEMPKGISTGDTHSGPYSDGTRTGKIVQVSRYGFFQNFCSFELRVGGLGEGSSITFSVIDEEVCTYLENAIALGLDVRVDYVQDLIELWQPSSYFCKGVQCILPENSKSLDKGPGSSKLGDAKPGGTTHDESRVTPELLATVKERLLADPKFVAELKLALERVQRK